MLGSLIPHRLLGWRVDNHTVLADVSNVPMLSGSCHSWDTFFPPLAHSFREVLVEDHVGSSQVLGSDQACGINSLSRTQTALSISHCWMGTSLEPFLYN